jgi:predicted adenylyl cyclase CyaB
MPSNIEIKARARNFDEMKARAEKLSNLPDQVIPQEDIFFNTPHGRLKLRSLAGEKGQLIYYTRPDQEGPKRSDYRIYHTSDPESLKQVLELAYGIRGIVRKTRYLYLVGQTRVHLDDVEGLGQFMELEVVMQEGQSDAEGQAIAEDLMERLGVARSDLLEGAYMDLLESAADSPTLPK